MSYIIILNSLKITRDATCKKPVDCVHLFADQGHVIKKNLTLVVILE